MKGRTESSAAQADLGNLLTNYQPPGIWNVGGGGVADSLGGGIQEAKRGGRQAGRKGAEQVEGYYGIASIKPEAVVKLCFPKTLFPPFSLTSPFFLFTALFLGGGGKGTPVMEDSQALSGRAALREARGAGWQAAGHARPSSPRSEDEKMSRDSIVGLRSPGQWVEGCISSQAEGGSPKGLVHPSRVHLFRDTLRPPSQPRARAPSGRASSPGPFPPFLCLKQGKKFGNKS